MCLTNVMLALPSRPVCFNNSLPIRRMASLVNNIPLFCIFWTGTDNSNHVPYSYWMPNPSAINSAWLLKSARYCSCFNFCCSMTEGTTLLFGARWLLKGWLEGVALDFWGGVE